MFTPPPPPKASHPFFPNYTAGVLVFQTDEPKQLAFCYGKMVFV